MLEEITTVDLGLILTPGKGPPFSSIIQVHYDLAEGTLSVWVIKSEWDVGGGAELYTFAGVP